MRASERLAIEDGLLLYERDLFCLCFSTEDKKEGVEAFLNKPSGWVWAVTARTAGALRDVRVVRRSLS
jgi:hypothetical protein